MSKWYLRVFVPPWPVAAYLKVMQFLDRRDHVAAYLPLPRFLRNSVIAIQIIAIVTVANPPQKIATKSANAR